MAFVHQITARFFEVDRAGIIFFGRIFEYCHTAYEQLLAAMGTGITELFEEHNLGMPLVHAEADFCKPIRMQERIDVQLEVSAISERSIHFSFRLVGSDDGVQRATASLVHAFVALDSFAPARPPLLLIEGLRKLGLIDDAIEPPGSEAG